MNKFYKLLLCGQFLSLTLAAQTKTFTITENIQPQPKANYQLASRFSPNKLKKMVYSTSVDPHWLKRTNRFWYTFETPKGKFWYLVDPATKSKKQLFDNSKIASDITLIVRDPFDAEHLPLENLKFSHDENSVTIEVKSTIDEMN